MPLYNECMRVYNKANKIDADKIRKAYWIIIDKVIETFKGVRKSKMHVLIQIGPKERGWFVKREDCYSYIDEDIYNAYDLWQNWKMFGLPYIKGWAEHPKRLVDIIKIIDNEYNSINKGK